MVEENVGSESIDQSNLPTTTNISTDDSNLLAKPKAIDIYSRVVGNPLVGSNPGEKNPYVSNEAYTDSLAEKIRNNSECTLEYAQFMDHIKSFRITVIWSNASNTNATSFIDIYNPNLK